MADIEPTEQQNPKKSFKIDEKTSLRAAIGLNAGMAIGLMAVFVAIIISSMVLWEKIFVAFGIFCGCTMQIIGTIGSIQRLKAYNAAMLEYARLNASQEPASYHG